MALHGNGSNCHSLAQPDADLQRVISAWAVQPEAIRRAILALVGYVQPPTNGKTQA
ncbi:MAG: hypothetical protein ABSG53_28980 [Thermoguttaceae bacterium]|jgi:hypothetical protein